MRRPTRRTLAVLGGLMLMTSGCNPDDGTDVVVQPPSPTPLPPVVVPGNPVAPPFWPTQEARLCPPSSWGAGRATSPLGQVHVDVGSEAQANTLTAHLKTLTRAPVGRETVNGVMRLTVTGLLSAQVEALRRTPHRVLPYTLANSAPPSVAVVRAVPSIDLLPVTFYLRTTDAAEFEQLKARLDHPRIAQRYSIIPDDNPGIFIIAVPDAPAALYEAFLKEEVDASFSVGDTPDLDPKNRDARLRHRVDDLAERHGTFGQGVGVVVHDDVGIFAHPALDGRLEDLDSLSVCPWDSDNPCYVDSRTGTSRLSKDHATHVAGTIAGRDTTDDRHGMASRASVYSRSFHFRAPGGVGRAGVPVGTLTTNLLGDARTRRAYISNHSYGPVTGYYYDGKSYRDAGNRTLFGAYDGRSLALDRFLASAGQDIVFVVAAGNDRNLHCANGSCIGPPANGELNGCLHDPESGITTSGYGTVNGYATAMNVIGIGALDSKTTPRGTIPAGVESPAVAADFSNFGPTSDGRMKPEISTSGNTINSTVTPRNGNSNSYADFSGTSMATPVATGIATLLQDAATGRTCTLTGRAALCADEMKAALVATAATGLARPDYQVGFGRVDALRARNVVTGEAGSALTRIDVSPGTIREVTLERMACTDCTPGVTAAWLDAGGARRDDVDIRLITPDGRILYPWVLDPVRPYARARQGVNPYDPVERIDLGAVPSPLGGEWRMQLRIASSGAGRAVDVAVALVGFRRTGT